LNLASLQPYPLLMDPFFSPRPWGGTALSGKLGKTPPETGGPYGEAWEVSDHPDGPSRVVNGPAAGMYIGDLFRSDPQVWLGTEQAPDRFPLLIKFIDAAQNLSIQVHPDDSMARPLGERGKAECWYVIDCPSGAEVIQGLIPEANAVDLRRAALNGRMAPLLRRAPIRPGDIILTPPGVVHALLEGTLVCEIQQSSNLTYRLWDWNRQPPRTLHIDEACAVSRATTPPPIVNFNDLTQGVWAQIARNPFFEIFAVQWSPNEHCEPVIPNWHGVAISVVHGGGQWSVEDGPSEPLRMGQTWFIPAGQNRAKVETGPDGLRLLLSRSLEII
jgi:mannose-6-phosphate isomerase